MSGTTREVLKTPEIKTPEELIKRLMDKSEKNLADRVRAIETTVTGNAESKWKRLQSELPDAEKQQIKTALEAENPEIVTRLKTVAVATVGVAGIATAIDQLDGSMEKTGLGKLGIKDSIKEWLTELLAEKPNPEDGFFGGVMHKLQLLFLVPLAKMFGVKMPEKGGKDPKDTQNSQKSDDKKNNSIVQGTEAKDIVGGVMFNKVAKSLVKFNPDKNIIEKKENDEAPTVISILASKHLTFSQISSIYAKNKSDNKSLVGDLKLSDTNPRTAEIAVASLMHGEKFLDSFFKKTDWKNMPLMTVLEGVGPEFKQLVEIEALETEEDVKKFITEMSNPFGKGGQLGENMKNKYEALQKRFSGMTPAVLASIFSLDGLGTKGVTNDFLDATFQEQKEKDFIKETLLPFREKFLSMLDNPRINGGKSVREYFVGTGDIKMSELLMIFIKTGGHMNFEEMNTMEQVSLYQSVFSLLIKRDEGEAAGYMTRLVNSESTDIPPEAKRVLGAIGEKGKDLLLKTIAASANISVGVFENLTPEQKAGVIAAGVIFLFAGRYIFGLKVLMITAGLTALITGTGVAAIFGEVRK